MQSIGLFFRRVFSGKGAAAKPRMMVRPRAFIQPTRPSKSNSHVSSTYTSDISEKEIDLSNKDTWSRGPDLLWLHNTQDKKRKMLKAKYERYFPAMGRYMPYIDLPEGRVHLARYFP